MSSAATTEPQAGQPARVPVSARDQAAAKPRKVLGVPRELVERSAAQDLGNCEAMVWGPGYWHKFRCTRAAKREVDGRRLCTQHAKVAERRKELHAR